MGGSHPYGVRSCCVRLALCARQLRYGQASCNGCFGCLTASHSLTTAIALGKKRPPDVFCSASPSEGSRGSLAKVRAAPAVAAPRAVPAAPAVAAPRAVPAAPATEPAALAAVVYWDERYEAGFGMGGEKAGRINFGKNPYLIFQQLCQEIKH